ncbi:hypothetical protein EKO27_g6579 [Xylaria grammica]|uniref:Uncharacterized protein n=1 Tax=Xylaria grammica TaxID=363999 RepID=A0A439D279_9PEZI|nr:hypothetical protein EKO27_g6579 [Xylaria grammica]
MGSTRKTPKATAPGHQQPSPSTMTSLPVYTSSYMVVQERSPPLSSPPPSSSNDAITSRLDPSRRNTEHGKSEQTAAPERSDVRSREAANGIVSSFQGTLPPSVEPRVRPKTSRSERISTQQTTTRRIKTLVKNKALLYDCIAEDKNEDDDDCEEYGGFQTWRQVKSWTMRHYRRRLRTKTKANPALPTNCFEKNLVPLLKAAEMALNARHFLKSVKEAMGARKLTRIFRHRLARDELPEDMAPLIFSPLYLRMCERHVRKLKCVRNSNDSESDGSDDEWSDWEEEGGVPLEGCSNEDRCPTTDAGTRILPSIEEDPPETSNPAVGQRADRPSTTIGTQEPETRVTQSRMSRKAQRRKEKRKARRRVGHEKRRTGSSVADRRRSRTPTPPRPSRTCDDLAHQPAPSQLRGQNRAPSAPRVRPFTDFMSPAATATPNPEAEPWTWMKTLLRDENERRNDISLGKDGGSEAAGNLRRLGTSSTPKKTATKDRVKDTATPNTSGGPPPPPRRTPSVLIVENERQAQKLARPRSRASLRKAKGPHQTQPVYEIPPRRFYNSSTGGATVPPRADQQAKAVGGGISKPKPKRPEPSRNAAAGRSGIKNKERAKRSNGAATPNRTNRTSRRQRSPSYQSSLSDDDVSFPPIEELCERLMRARAMAAQTQPQSQPETAARKGADKKRRRGEPPSECRGPPTKRIKRVAGASSSVAEGGVHANPQVHGRKRRGGDGDRSRGPSLLSQPNVCLPTPKPQKKWRSTKPVWQTSPPRAPRFVMPIG